MSASYPTSAKSFTTKNTGDFVQSADVDDLQDEVTAIEAALVTGPLALPATTFAGDVKFTDATYDIGKSGATRPRDLFVSRNGAVGGTFIITGQTTVGDLIVKWINLSQADGGQIVFPATQNASAGANTLDDYKEGSFTPRLIGTVSGEATYSTQFGHYRKIGKWVDVYIYIATATVGTLSGNLRLSALPYTSAANTVNGVLICPHFTTIGSNAIWLGGIVGTSLTTVDINRVTASGASVAAAPIATVAASEFVFFVHYEAAT